MRLLANKKTLSSCIFKFIPGTASTAIAEIVCARTQEAQSPPKRTGPLPDSHFEGIISLITHDAKGYINVQKSSQSVNHQTGTETLITTTHPAPRIGREHRIPHLLRTKKKKKAHKAPFNIEEKRITASESKATPERLQRTSTQGGRRACNFDPKF